jgi:hypothetical protein
MKFPSKRIGSALVLLLAGGMSLGAQDYEQTIKFGLINPQGDMRQLTQSAVGYGFEYNLDILPSKEAGIGVGFAAGWFNSEGKKSFTGSALEPTGNPYDAATGTVPDPMYLNGAATVKSTWIGIDLLYAVENTPLTIRTGPIMASWDVTQLHPIYPNTGAMGETGFKLGWRFGLDYRFSKSWSGSIFYSQAHWQNLTNDSINPNNEFQSNPSWVSIMAGYKF